MASEPPFAPRASRTSYETRIILKAAVCALPGLIVASALLAYYGATWEVWVTAYALMIVPFPFLAWSLQGWIVHPMRVAANVIGAIREQDYTLRGRRGTEADGVVWELYQEINDLAALMETTRTGGIEARAAIDKIAENIDVATLIIGADRKVVQANQSARRLIASINHWDVSPIGRSVDELNVAFCVDAASSDFSRFSFVTEGRRFEGRRGIFRIQGERFDLALLTDITKAASEQERESWQRLLRVLGHELNNSIAPIRSLAGTLSKIARATEMEPEAKRDLLESLDAISSRADSIVRFMQDYTQLARLPEPRLERCDLEPLLRKAAQLFPGFLDVDLRGEPCFVSADPGQLQLALINLIKNASEATSNAPGGARCSYRKNRDTVTISLVDDGPGIANVDNLFVPFYTTKQQGSGIGLAISKQIVESVGGSLALANRQDRPGCVATVELKLK